MEVRQRKAPENSGPNGHASASPKGKPSPDEPPGASPQRAAEVHKILQSRLRCVSAEDEDLFAAVLSEKPDSQPGQSPKTPVPCTPSARASSPLSGSPRAEEPGTLAGKVRARARAWHDALEDWGFRNFPVITDHFNFLVYSVDLAWQGIKWFQFGVTACWLGARLIVYSIMLLPAFVRVMLMYYHDPRIQRRIRYGPAEREYLDIYVPKEALAAQRGEGPKVPVVVAVMGGAFIIGHRAYNAQLGLRLMDFGVITVGVDYRNFPRGIIPDMVEDIGRGVRWVFQNIDIYGGDTSNIMLLGQSAGAHLTAMLLLEHSLLEASASFPSSGATEQPAAADARRRCGLDLWSVKDFKAYLGVSGPYDLIKLAPHLASRGLYPKIMDHMTEGDLAGSSPERLLDTEEWQTHKKAAVELLPHFHLFHGYKDKAVPVWSSSDFAEKLKESGVSLTLDLRRDMTHTYPVIEGPMRRHDAQVEIILPVLFGQGAEKQLEEAAKLPPLWPVRILDIAGHVSPF